MSSASPDPDPDPDPDPSTRSLLSLSADLGAPDGSNERSESERENRIEQNFGALGRLLKRYNELGQKLAEAAGEEWQALPAPSGPRTIRDALHRLDLNARDHEADVLRALDMLAVQADERIKLSVEDPLRFFRFTWRPGVLTQGLQLPNEKTARQSARPDRGKPVGQAKPHPPEDYAGGPVKL
ncbi:MAG: hypothetical protein MJE77_38775 [Proteobacteria bacterium]|nr:hypothetical protein [Pseudomonadota bacterium]